MIKTKVDRRRETLELQRSFMDLVKGGESDVAAHQILEKLAEKLKASGFGIGYGRDDNPTLRAGFFFESDGCKPADSTSFQAFTLASIRKNGKLVAGERGIALWNLSELYDRSPIEFKCDAYMTLEEYAFWMRTSLADVEKTFCQEVLLDLMRHVKHDPMWRIFSIVDGWIEIDPWKFFIEVDLG